MAWWQFKQRQQHTHGTKLQALVYDILPSTTAVFSYAIGSRKLSANEQGCCCFLPGVDAPHVYVGVWALASTVLSVPEPFGGR